MIDLLYPLIAYLMGSISSAVLVSRLMGLPDPRTEGSNNPGATNVLRLGSKSGAALTLLGDVLKGVIPVLLATQMQIDTPILALTGAAAFLGHLYPVFFGFQGGKGVATAFGVFIGLSLKITGLLLVVWLVMAALFRYSSLAALTAACAAPVMTWWILGDTWLSLMCVGIAALLIWRHRANIKRLLDGSESRIGKKG